MNKEQKTATIEELKGTFANNNFFYIADSSSMTVADISKFRRACFEKGVTVKVYKNTLIQKALESFEEDKGYAPLYDVLKGQSTLIVSETANLPAKILEEFRKGDKSDNPKPALKAAYIDSDVYVGDDQIKSLASLKSKEDLIGDVMLLLQSPIKNVLGSLQSGGNTLSGLLKALEERGDQ